MSARCAARVLRATGAQFEASISFAALNQVLFPVFDELRRLSAAHGRALSVAVGLSDGPAPDQLMVSNAALSLLIRAGAARPSLVIVDDLPWVDRSSAVALGFAARRLAGSRVGFLAASRSGEEGFFDQGGLPGYELQPLDDAAAKALLADRFPALAPRVRQRLLAEAQGNPLALLELPVALAGPHHAALDPPSAVLPISQRLVSVFASRVQGLPAATRHLLLLAVLDGTGDLGIVSAAAGHRGTADLAPAERAGLVRVDGGTGRLAFRHPLTRSAVVELSTSSERLRAHKALADQLADQPERRVWHLAEATVEPDEGVAALLEQVAYQILRRGDGVAAISALTRAAELSPRGAVNAAINSMTRWAVPRSVGVVHHLIGHVRALAAMGRGDFEDAYQAATAMSPAGTLASHVQEALLVIMDVVEAAVRTGRRAEAAAHLAAIREADLAAISPRIALLVRGSEAIAAPDDQAVRLFGEALAVPGTDQWPFYLARVQLAYGERLRRLHANRDARLHLRTALETFERLGARPWAARAGSELRANKATMQVHGLQKSFKQLHVLKGVDSDVARGSIFALLGSNGAGKRGRT
jgi:hypothetical protein